MNRKALLVRTAVGAVGGLMLVTMAGVAFAAEVDNDDVDVTVTIPEDVPVGALTMSVASNATALTQQADDTEGHLVFTGTLPTVTVTDDRTVVPDDMFWYVNGQSSAFTSTTTTDTIGADRLGWTPALLTADGDGQVAEGGETVPSVDDPTQGTSGSSANNVGLAAAELLALNVTDSADAATVGSWTANAALTLKADADTEAGAYKATITLTLWEDAI